MNVVASSVWNRISSQLGDPAQAAHPSLAPLRFQTEDNGTIFFGLEPKNSSDTGVLLCHLHYPSSFHRPSITDYLP
ncbi:hypothetical protein PGTUg99_012095 [Puccinia graminis f. sp. tritici]|uniref:Uncharacterized protein n=1 Tax=Puccinia graminis f. sp. tritici TaxID=56615 RepID=A0A5B0Q0I1_PUCGR|nr:hypothetical protein PGTUg99_012095 [Puccinia graminis f. sp. tritici]